MGREADLKAEEHRKRIMATIAAGPNLIDRFRRPVVTGGQYEFHETSNLPVVFTVADMQPDLRIDGTPNMWFLTLKAEIIIPVMQGRPAAELTLVAMPQPVQAADQQNQGNEGAQDNGPAASDAPAAPTGSILLTDLDKTATKALDESPLKQGLSLVPPASDSGDQA